MKTITLIAGIFAAIGISAAVEPWSSTSTTPAPSVTTASFEDSLWILDVTSDSGGSHTHLNERRAQWYFNSVTHLLTETWMSEGEPIGTVTREYKVHGTEVFIDNQDGTRWLQASFVHDLTTKTLTLIRISPAPQSFTTPASTVTGVDLSGNPVSHTIPAITAEEPSSWVLVSHQ